MFDSLSELTFSSDRRGVSAVLGFILLFGILMLSLTTYQAQIVPQENSVTEFQHFEDVRDEMVGVRNSISTAGQADVSQFSDLTLGTNYQSRTFTINPPPPSGTLETSEEYNITITNGSATTNVSTRFLEYQPDYSEIDVGSIWYEHSVLYLDERDRGNGVSIIEDQNILKDNTVRITALQNQFREDGTEQIALELYPQEDLTDGDGDFPTGSDLSVTIPTRLDNETYWDDELGGKDEYEGVDIDARGDGVHTLNLTVDSDNIEVNTVGTRSEPNEEPAKNIDPVIESSISDEDGSDDADSSALNGVRVGVSNTDLQFDMENNGSNSITIEEIAVDTTPIQTGNTIETSASSNEVDITGSTTNGVLRTKNNEVLQADGTKYDFKDALVVNNGNGQYAEIAAGDVVSVDIREFSQRLDNGGRNELQFTTSTGNADVIITFVLSDGTEEILYLEQS